MNRTIVNKTRVALTVGLAVAAAFTACVEEGEPAPPLMGAPGPTQEPAPEDAGMAGSASTGGGAGGGSGAGGTAGMGGTGMGGTDMGVDAGAGDAG